MKNNSAITKMASYGLALALGFTAAAPAVDAFAERTSAEQTDPAPVWEAHNFVSPSTGEHIDELYMEATVQGNRLATTAPYDAIEEATIRMFVDQNGLTFELYKADSDEPFTNNTNDTITGHSMYYCDLSELESYTAPAYLEAGDTEWVIKPSEGSSYDPQKDLLDEMRGKGHIRLSITLTGWTDDPDEECRLVFVFSSNNTFPALYEQMSAQNWTGSADDFADWTNADLEVNPAQSIRILCENYAFYYRKLAEGIDELYDKMNGNEVVYLSTYMTYIDTIVSFRENKAEFDALDYDKLSDTQKGIYDKTVAQTDPATLEKMTAIIENNPTNR